MKLFYSYFIFDRTAARLSVFWNRALIICFTSSAVISLARGPEPSAQRSSKTRRLESSTMMSSLNLAHLRTYLSGLEAGLNRSGVFVTI